MEIDEIDRNEFPKKLLDKKQFVRVDPETGIPQLIRMETAIGENGAPILDTVVVFIDDKTEMVMEREAALEYIDSLNCTPLEVNAHHKHRTQH